MLRMQTILRWRLWYLQHKQRTQHCCWNHRLSSFCQQHNCCNRVDRLTPKPMNTGLAGTQCKRCRRQHRCRLNTFRVCNLSNRTSKKKVKSMLVDTDQQPNLRKNDVKITYLYSLLAVLHLGIFLLGKPHRISLVYYHC